MKNPRSIRALFALPGFTATSKLVGVFGDHARIISALTVVNVVDPRIVLSVAGWRIYLLQSSNVALPRV